MLSHETLCQKKAISSTAIRDVGLRLPGSPCPESAPAPPAPGAHGRGCLCTVDASLPCGTGTPRLSGCGGRKSREGRRPHFITHHACTRAHTSSRQQAGSRCPKMEIFVLGWWDSGWALFLKLPRMANCLFNNNIEKNQPPYTKPWLDTNATLCSLPRKLAFSSSINAAINV